MSRSRRGCTTCKRRHRKCDERRPTCLACEAQGLECEGYDIILRWDTGATRGQGARATRPAIDSASQSTPRSSAITQAARTLAPSRPLASPRSRRPAAQGHVQIQPAPRQLLPTSQRSEPAEESEEHRLLREFSKDTIFYLYSTHRDSPFAEQVYQVALESETLRCIIAAMHLYITRQDDSGPKFEGYSTRGVALFRRQLEHYDGSLDAGVLYAGLFICTLNLFQGIPWSALLEHMVNVYDVPANLSSSTRVNHPAVDFTFEAIAVMDLPTFVRGRSGRSLGIWSRMRDAQAASSAGRVKGGIEPLSGLPRTLLDIFATIEDDSAEEAFLAWPGEVGEVPFCHLWEAYRIAGVLVGRRVRSADRASLGAQPPAGLPKPAAEVLVARLVACLDALCETSTRPEYANVLAANSVCYPYMAARLEVAVLQGERHWMDALKRVKQVCQPYGSTENARTVEAMLDEAQDMSDNMYDVDEQARKRGVELATF